VYDIDKPSASLDLHDFIGYSECTLGQIVAAGYSGLSLPLIQKKTRYNPNKVPKQVKQSKGKIILVAEELVQFKEEVCPHFFHSRSLALTTFILYTAHCECDDGLVRKWGKDTQFSSLMSQLPLVSYSLKKEVNQGEIVPPTSPTVQLICERKSCISLVICHISYYFSCLFLYEHEYTSYHYFCSLGRNPHIHTHKSTLIRAPTLCWLGHRTCFSLLSYNNIPFISLFSLGQYFNLFFRVMNYCV